MNTSLLALVLLGASAHAADTVNITVRGTLTRPPCALSTSTTLVAEFGDVRTDQVATTAPQPIPVRMTCPAGSALNVSFSANSGTHTATVAKTSMENLGVSLIWASDSTAANLTGTARSYSNLSGNVDISLNAQLVARGALTPGVFSSSMVMTIDYL